MNVTHRLRLIIIALSGAGLIGMLVAAAVLPGPQHIACPTCHGLQKIAPGIYIEAAANQKSRQQLLTAVRQAKYRVTAFFGSIESAPRVVACLSRTCAQQFGAEGAKGVAYGWHAILLTRSRILPVIATHEFVHTELHWRMGFLGWLRGTVPAWFDEGLATVISADPRFTRDQDVASVREIMKVHSYLGQWSAHARRVGWRTAYGAASTRVRQLERLIGRDGLRRFVLDLARGGNLPALLSNARAYRVPPTK